jgi:hypothetical protein
MPPEPDTSSQSPIRIKFLSKAQSADRDYDRWLRRLPGGYNRWENCEFIFEQDCDRYDWLVVYDDLPRLPGQKNPFWEEILACPRERTLLITTEPSSIKLYGYGFLRQFGWVLTSQEPRFIRHPGMIHRQAGLVWFYGNTDVRGTFDHLASTAEPPGKSADLSTVCSAKSMRHTLHANRVAFTQALKTAIPDMEIYGQGVREIPDKADALDPFRYHLAIENHVAPHHWTEKLSDPFLGWCLPIYHGCPNAADYFPEESFIPFDMLDFGAAKDLILKAIRDDEYSRRLPAIREARRLALLEYATFPQVARIITERHLLPTAEPAGREAIISRHLWRKRHPVEAISQLVRKSALQLRQRLTQPVVRENRPTP